MTGIEPPLECFKDTHDLGMSSDFCVHVCVIDHEYQFLQRFLKGIEKSFQSYLSLMFFKRQTSKKKLDPECCFRIDFLVDAFERTYLPKSH